MASNSQLEADLRTQSLEFEKKFLVFQLQQEKLKTQALLKKGKPMSSQEEIDNLKLQLENLKQKLNEKDQTIVDLQKKLSPTNEMKQLETKLSELDTTASSSGMQAVISPNIEELQKLFESTKAEKEKLIFQLQMTNSEKHNLLSQNFQMTMQTQANKAEKEDLQKQINWQKVENDQLLSAMKKTKEDSELNNLKAKKEFESKISGLQKQLQNITKENNSNKLERTRLLNQAQTLQAEVNSIKTEKEQLKGQLEQEKQKLQSERNGLQSKVNSLTNSLKEQAKLLENEKQKSARLDQDLRGHHNGAKFLSVCQQIQELGKHMEILQSIQMENYQQEVSTLKDQLKEQKDANSNCPICFDAVRPMGDHRLVSLPCGHLFGEKCIRLCIQQTPKCPQCRVNTSTQGLRYIYNN